MLNVKIFSFPPTFQNKNGKSFKQIIKYNTVNFIKSFNQNYKQKIVESKSQVEVLFLQSRIQNVELILVQVNMGDWQVRQVIIHSETEEDCGSVVIWS